MQNRHINEHLVNPQSTHGLAPEASAARLIELLRSVYPNIKTHCLLDAVSEGAVSSSEARVPESFETRSQVSLAQASLVDYLIGLIKNLKTDAVLPVDPNINSSVSIRQ